MRSRAHRLQLNGWDCWECKKYYKSLSLSKTELQKRKNKCSRHQHKYKRPHTPEGFWDPEIPETLPEKDMERPKRNGGKPSRHQTTSSDESTTHKKIPKTVTVGDIDEDISQLRGVLENPDDERSIDDENSFNEDIYTQNYPESQPHNFTQTQSQINIPSNTFTVTHVTSQPHTSTNIPPYTSSVTQSTLYPHTNISPYTSSVTHSTSHPHTSHAIETSHPIHTLPGHSFMVNHHPNNSYQFQDNLRRWPAQDNERNEHQTARAEILQSVERTDYQRITQENLSSVNAELKRMNGLLQNILRCVQNNNDRDRVPRKPVCLPISSVDEMDAFQTMDDDDYREVVNYFKYIGGFNLKEAVNLCLKEGLQDSLTPSYTWWGREKDQRPFYNSRFVFAIYEAVSSNRYFDKPTRSEFQRQMREALRTAKQRCRSKILVQHKRHTVNHRYNLWNDDEQETQEERADE